MPAAGGGALPVLAIDLGGTNLRVAAFGRDGRLLKRVEERVVRGAGPDAIVDRVLSLGRRVAGTPAFAAVGVSCPGLIDAGGGLVIGARNLGWRDVALGPALVRGFGTPVRVENDVNLAALGEWRFGAGGAAGDLAFLSVGTGVGVGLVVDGHIHRGAHFAAGEVNLLPSGVASAPGVPVAGIEDVASGPAIVRRAVAAGLAAADLTTEAVFAAAAAGDGRAARVIAEAVSALADVVAWTVALVDPAVLVIGGGVSRQGDAFVGQVRAAAERRLSVRAAILPSALGGDAQLYGAAKVALDLAGSGH